MCMLTQFCVAPMYKEIFTLGASFCPFGQSHVDPQLFLGCFPGVCQALDTGFEWRLIMRLGKADISVGANEERDTPCLLFCLV